MHRLNKVGREACRTDWITDSTLDQTFDGMAGWGSRRRGKPPHLWNTVLKYLCRWKRPQNGALESINRRGWMEMLPDFPDCLKRVPETGRLQAFRRNPAFNQNPLFNPKFYFQSLSACFPKNSSGILGLTSAPYFILRPAGRPEFFNICVCCQCFVRWAGWCLLVLSPVW